MDVYVSIGLSIIVIAVFILFYNKIFAVTFDESFATATGTNAKKYNLLIAVITAMVIVLAMNYSRQKKCRIVNGPEIYTRGFIFEKEYEHIIGEMKEKVVAICTAEHLAEINPHDLGNQIRSSLAKYVLERTGRKPMIMALVSQV